MSTEAQRAANRTNAQHSTGPRTDTGKARSAQNHFWHGLAGRFVLLPDEKQTEFYELVIALKKEHQPVTPTELLLVERLAQHWWLTQRALRLQNECLAQNGELAQFTVYLRYQTAHERAFSRTLNDLLKLRRERRHTEAHATRHALARQKLEFGFERQRAQQAAGARRELLDQVNLSIARTKHRTAEMNVLITEQKTQALGRAA